MKKFTSVFKGVRGRLILSSFIPIFALVLVSVMSFNGISRLTKQSEVSNKQIVPKITYLSVALNAKSSLGYYLWAALGSYFDPKLHKDFVTSAKKSLEDFKKSTAAFQAVAPLEGEQEYFATLSKYDKKFIEITTETIAWIESNQPDTREKALNYMSGGDWYVTSNAVQSAVESLNNFYNSQANQISIDSEKMGREINLVQILVSLFATIATFAFSLILGLKISSSVGKVVEKLNRSGQDVADAIIQLSTAGQNLSQSSTSAAASLEETVASLEEMSSIVKLNSENAVQAASLSQASRQSAEKGEHEIRLLVDSMKDIATSSKRIEEIIQVIDDIAFQTNLLALNAAVEAARAGEQGKGFAVVADAVRTLAQRSATAAKDISVLIQESVDKIDRGTSIADRSGTVMAEIVSSVKKVSDLANEIATSSGEQSSGIGQVSKAMNSLDQGAQTNAASSEEIAGTAQEISNQTEVMRGLVAELNTIVTGIEESKAA
ncbi:MAG: methyl-accepting chemotaxis protein [Bdellovibrionia bacterium]